jgi:hypothetical protein
MGLTRAEQPTGKHKLDPAPPPSPPTPGHHHPKHPVGPWRPKPGPAVCSITLKKQASSATCTQGDSFGCYDGLLAMWIDEGCRGEFEWYESHLFLDRKWHILAQLR